MATERAIALLAAEGAGSRRHARGRTLLDHLVGTAEILRRWGQPVELQDAALLHSVYGTEVYEPRLLPTSRRGDLVDVVGERAERLAYLFSVTSREALFAGHLPVGARGVGASGRWRRGAAGPGRARRARDPAHGEPCRAAGRDRRLARQAAGAGRAADRKRRGQPPAVRRAARRAIGRRRSDAPACLRRGSGGGGRGTRGGRPPVRARGCGLSGRTGAVRVAGISRSSSRRRLDCEQLGPPRAPAARRAGYRLGQAAELRPVARAGATTRGARAARASAGDRPTRAVRCSCSAGRHARPGPSPWA